MKLTLSPEIIKLIYSVRRPQKYDEISQLIWILQLINVRSGINHKLGEIYSFTRDYIPIVAQVLIITENQKYNLRFEADFIYLCKNLAGKAIWYIYRISSYKTRGYYFFVRPSTAGIIRMRLLFEGWYYCLKEKTLKIKTLHFFVIWMPGKPLKIHFQMILDKTRMKLLFIFQKMMKCPLWYPSLLKNKMKRKL